MVLSFAVMAVFASGCAHDHLSRGRAGVRLARGHGDAGRFILQKAIEYHCVPIRTNSLPAFPGAWYWLEEDSEPQKAVLVVMSEDDFPALVAFLRQAFGQPSIGPEDMRDGWRYGEYSFGRPDGARIEFRSGAHRTQVTIIEPVKRKAAAVPQGDGVRYKGKTLDAWLRSYKLTTGTDPGEFVSSLEPVGQFEIVQNHELREAIQYFGTNAIPTLLCLVRAEDSGYGRKVIGFPGEQQAMTHKPPARQWNEAGAWGFQVLGTNAESAVPALTTIASENNSFYSRAAALCSLAWIGTRAKQAVPYLLQQATKTNAVPNDPVEVALRKAAKDALVEIDPEAAAKAEAQHPRFSPSN